MTNTDYPASIHDIVERCADAPLTFNPPLLSAVDAGRLLGTIAFLVADADLRAVRVVEVEQLRRWRDAFLRIMQARVGAESSTAFLAADAELHDLWIEAGGGT